MSLEVDNCFIAVIAALPPPVNGNYWVSSVVVGALKQRHPVEVFNLSPGSRFKGVSWRLIKALRSAISLIRLLQWRLQGAARLYTVADSGGGLYYNIVTISWARLLGYRCVLHHHSYSYLNTSNRKMRLINRLLGTSGTHVVLAPEMAARFQKVYGDSARVFVLPNTFVIDNVTAPESGKPWQLEAPFRLGHISNITIEKGLKHVLSTFEVLKKSRDVHLTLAGPLMGKPEKILVDKMLHRYPDSVRHLGPIYDDEKMRFFQDIDVLLFPTEYHVEAQPLVIFEAFDFGKPVIAYGRACIPSMIGTDGGHSIPIDKPFVADAVRIIEAWIDDPTTYETQCDAVRAWAKELREDIELNMTGFRRLFQSTDEAEHE